MRPLLLALLAFSFAALSPAALPAADSSSLTPHPNLAHPPEIITPARLATLSQLAPHPRLLATASDFSRLRAQLDTDAPTAELLALLRTRADAFLAYPPINYAADPHNIVGAARDAQRRILTFALVHRLAPESQPDPRHLAALRAVVAGLLAQPWPRGHFLGTAEAALTLAVAYDWLQADLTPAELDAIAMKLRTEALLPTIEEEEKMGWIWADHNWNQVCHGGLVAAALALAERDPALSARVINRALAHLPRAAASYAPDGIYPEGPSYWGYGTTYHLLQLETYRSALGSSLGLETFPGFLASAACLDLTTGPTGQFFNYGDNHPRHTYSAAALWFARENQRPDLALAELTRVRALAPTTGAEDARELPLILLWWRPLPAAASSTSPATPSPLHWRGESIQPLATLRSAWDDPRATWLALKGGTAHHSHAHMDAGTFVFEAQGIRWALDPAPESYAKLRANGYDQSEIFNYTATSRRWAVFRFGPEAHNILRFDGAPQNVDGRATLGPIVHSPDGSASIEINLDSTYAGQAVRVRRTATLRPDASVVLADTWTTLDRPTTSVTWQWLTRATVTREPDGALRLDQDGRTLRLAFAPAPARIELQPSADLLSPRIDTALPAHTRIVAHLATPAQSPAALTVTLTPTRP